MNDTTDEHQNSAENKSQRIAIKTIKKIAKQIWTHSHSVLLWCFSRKDVK